LLVPFLAILGSPALAAQSTVSPYSGSEALFFDDLPVVLSASRISQSLADAPVAVTIIDRDTIEASGFTEIPDLMRLVPGYLVNYDSGHLPVVGYHLLNDRFSKRMQVLIDGRAVYTPTLGGVPWLSLPLTIDDIDRIEVVRGPNAANYGSNSFLGVINIITRPASLDQGHQVKVLAGENGRREVFVRAGRQTTTASYRLVAGYRTDAGFERRADDRDIGLLSGRLDYQINARDNLLVKAGANDGTFQEDNVFDPEVPVYDRRDSYRFAQFKWSHTVAADDEYYVQFYYNYHNERNTYTSLPVSSPVTYVNNQDFGSQRYDLEIVRNHKPNPELNLVWGASARQDRIQSPGYTGSAATKHNTTLRVFGSGRWQASNRLVVNLGAMWEDNDITGADISPQLSFNYRLSNNQTLRLAASRAIRVPVILEEQPDYKVDKGGLLDQFFFDNGTLAPERITAYELGYIAYFPDYRATIDARVFHEKLQGLITYRPALYPPDTYDGIAGYFDNVDDATLHGFELGLDFKPAPVSRLRLAFTHNRIDATDVFPYSTYSSSAPANSLSMLYSLALEQGYQANLGLYHTTATKQLASEDIRRPLTRVDTRLAKQLRIGRYRLATALIVHNLFDERANTRLRNVIGRTILVEAKMNF